MKKNNPSRHKLKEILAHQKYEDLEPFQQTATWEALNQQDRQSLAALFVLRGEKQLENADQNGIESFKIASEIMPDSVDLFYRMGSAYAMHQSNYASLKLAEGSFKKVLALDEDHLNAKIGLGNVYVYLGNIEEDEDYYLHAVAWFNMALINFKGDQQSLFHLLWSWGLSCYYCGKKSGETHDYINALNKFQQAADLGIQAPFFWTNYGNVYMEIAFLLNKKELYLEAVECYRKEIREAFDFFEGWISLASAYQRLFEITLAEDYFNQSDECLKMALQLNDSSPTLYLHWGILLYEGGRFFRDPEMVQESIVKLEKANTLLPDDANILCKWAQALMFQGVHTENINKIQAAQQKILESLQKDPESIESWYYYGLCLVELGKYFNDEDYFYEAIDKFTQGLMFNDREARLYYGLAIAQFAIGDIYGDLEGLEKALALFTKVSELAKNPLRQFWNDWGVVLMKLSELTHDKNHVFSALEKFDKALEDSLTDNFEKGIDPEWLYNYGCAWDFLGDFQEDPDCYEHAIAALTKVLEMDPSFSHARYNLALAYAHFGELCLDIESFHKSIEHFQILLSQDSEDEMGWNDYGVTLIHLSQLIREKTTSDHSLALYELAESKLLQSAALGNIQSYYNLACLYSLMNNQSYSMHFLEKAHDAEALPPLKEILEDEWLEALRTTNAFQNFVSNLPPSQRQDLEDSI